MDNGIICTESSKKQAIGLSTGVWGEGGGSPAIYTPIKTYKNTSYMQKGQKVYIKEQGIHFRKSPDISDDKNIIRDLELREEAILIDEPWLKVKIREQEGWVRSDKTSETAPIQTLSTQQSIAFVIGQVNLADNSRTIEVRKAIKDEFGGGVNKWSLQCTEYVMYRVKEKTGATIQWPEDRPRHGGKWAEIFQRHGLYKILAEPQANCAMCFTAGISTDPGVNEIGHVAFVEEVLPNGSIKISEANWPRDGIYNERIIPKIDWESKYKGRFLQFT